MLITSKLPINELKKIARNAGLAIMDVYNSNDLEVSSKTDDDGRTSPVTIADIAAHNIIVEGLRGLFPDTPIVSEEQSEQKNTIATQSSEFWIIDPLDGTKEFINRGTDFTVNIGLIQNRIPVFGIIYVPAEDTYYWGEVEHGAWKQEQENSPSKLHVSQATSVECAVASKSHFDAKTEKFLKQFGDIKLAQAGSSLKLCLVAEGKAEIYPRFAPTMEWDTAAADAIVRAAGGIVYDQNGKKELMYCKSGLKNLGFICVPPTIYFETRNV